MNAFLQRMLKKSDDELDYPAVMETHQRVECSPSKSNWVQKFSSPPYKHRSYSARPNTPPLGVEPITRSVTFPQEAPDVGHIRKEFEMNYQSPSKPQDADKGGKFVKQMVAALEQKHKSCKDPLNGAVENSWMRRSLPTVSVQHAEARKNFLNETFMISTSSVESLDISLNSQETQSCPDNQDPQFSPGSLDFLNDEDIPADETLVTSSCSLLEQDLSHPLINQDEAPLPMSSSPVEMKPKIVGAFLKKPIEVEDTSIGWIPITGKKLPRKSSFKRLLSILTGRKSFKGSKLYCSQSQNDLPEEIVKEQQDSGYDEKTSSTSSLTSLVSFSEVVHRQERLPEVVQRPMSTFQAPQAKPTANQLRPSTFQAPQMKQQVHPRAEFEEIYAEPLTSKLIFQEIPRSEVRLSLGPGFPLRKAAPKESSSSLGSNLDDYSFDSDSAPAISPLPKHPFVSSKDLLGRQSPQLDVSGLSGSSERSSQLREVVYDTPRSYLSKSEPGLFTASCSSGFSTGSFDGPVYDVPTARVPPRPRSSVYEDALSLKRRTASVSGIGPSAKSQFYAFHSEDEPHYATVKPRNTKVFPSQDLLRSMANVSPTCRTPVSSYLAFNQFAGF